MGPAFSTKSSKSRPLPPPPSRSHLILPFSSLKVASRNRPDETCGKFARWLSPDGILLRRKNRKSWTKGRLFFVASREPRSKTSLLLYSSCNSTCRRVSEKLALLNSCYATRTSMFHAGLDLGSDVCVCADVCTCVPLPAQRIYL